ncbi:hypothetical protein [Hymenobacter sp. CRA2]|uniref:hypothetical protein n=1 Tax=Hymenobacter sp. CRA2 TaxID=1955620 RepID=UPI00098FDBB5|nr:hypothetical protein [Hymenobacter sp. CRA2]OON69599.1 hypothetical protein B0919_06570 [Hymenobacter sp. CRA2]
MNSPLPPKQYSRYPQTSSAGSVASPRYTYSSSASCTAQYHRYRYGRHGRLPRESGFSASPQDQ